MYTSDVIFHVIFNRMLVSAGKDLKEPLLTALAEREDGNRNGKMVVCINMIIFRQLCVCIYIHIYDNSVLMAQLFCPNQWLSQNVPISLIALNIRYSKDDLLCKTGNVHD